eukprot:scaffold77399_cov76-Phaeocystis_antarctica.AAC.2
MEVVGAIAHGHALVVHDAGVLAVRHVLLGAGPVPHLVAKRRVLHRTQHLLGPAVVLHHAVSCEVRRRLQGADRQVVPRRAAVATLACQALGRPGHVPRHEQHDARLVRQDVLKASEGIRRAVAVLVRALRVGPHAGDVGVEGRLVALVGVDLVDDLLGQAHVLALCVGERLLVDVVSRRSRPLVLYPVFLIVRLHEEAVRPRVVVHEATHQLAIQVCDDGSIGQMACVVTVKCRSRPMRVPHAVIVLLLFVAWWGQHGGLGGGQSSGGATPPIGSDERVIDLLSVAGALE